MTDNAMIHAISGGLTAEMIAGVCKLMTNLDLISVAKKIHNEKTANTTIGRPGTFSSRLQPNHPSDDLRGIMAATMEGLSMGIGDAVIGLNPVNDTVDNLTRILTTFHDFCETWQVPTQTDFSVDCRVGKDQHRVWNQPAVDRRGEPAWSRTAT